MKEGKEWKSSRTATKWRQFLTAEEAAFIANADKVQAQIEAQRRKYIAMFSRERQLIVNRAVHRAKEARQ